MLAVNDEWMISQRKPFSIYLTPMSQSTAIKHELLSASASPLHHQPNSQQREFWEQAGYFPGFRESHHPYGLNRIIKLLRGRADSHDIAF